MLTQILGLYFIYICFFTRTSQVCDKWYHASCEKIGEDDIAIWNSLREAYICRSCRTLSDGTFDYLMGLRRLQQVNI